MQRATLTNSLLVTAIAVVVLGGAWWGWRVIHRQQESNQNAVAVDTGPTLPTNEADADQVIASLLPLTTATKAQEYVQDLLNRDFVFLHRPEKSPFFGCAPQSVHVTSADHDQWHVSCTGPTMSLTATIDAQGDIVGQPQVVTVPGL